MLMDRDFCRKGLSEGKRLSTEGSMAIAVAAEKEGLGNVGLEDKDQQFKLARATALCLASSAVSV